jgi:hypothetical protein
MSRVMEIVSADTLEVVSKRVYTAFRRIGKVLEYKPTEFIEGRIFVNGWPALVTVEWRPHRDGKRVCVDIAATSNDELSRAADEAMYRLAREFKAIGPDDLAMPPPQTKRTIGWVVLAVLITGGLAALLLGLPPFGE